MRLVQRSSILMLASAVALSTAACGGGGDDDSQTVNPAGTAHTYVVDRVLLPTKPGDGTKYGLDLDGDGNVDNALGSILSALSSAAGSGNLSLQSSIDDSVTQGKIILLANLKATALDMATGVAMEIFVGANPNPAPCTDPNNPTPQTCGNHLKGTASFTIDPAGPQDAQIVGKIIGGRFTGGPGTVTLEITLSSTVGAPIQLSLIGARAQLPGITADAIASDATPGIIAGAITQDDLNNKVIPAVQSTVSMQIARDCTDLTNPPACGCKSGSTGATVLSLFDKPKSTGCPDCVVDCKVTIEEIKESDLIETLLAPDVSINGTMALSVGVGVTAVKGTFDVPAGR